jgi:carboxymethylenebutenolidase
MDLKIPAPNGELDSYLCVPVPEVSGAGPWPGVVVLPDILGLSVDIRSIADRFGTAGYLTLVVNPYNRGGFLRCIRSIFAQMRAGAGPAFDDIEAARALLAGRPDCTGKVGVTGFCMGCGFALLAAPRGFDVSAPYYGAVPDHPSMLAGACPVVASFGGRDVALRGAADRLRRTLTELGVPNDVKEYPDAGHSFANRLPLGPLNVLLKVAFGAGYHHGSSEDAWRRVLAFFATHLR